MIKTAVIFCGGYGSRLGSITKNKPKPMVIVNNKPFLEHILLQLKNFGIKKIFLLVGFKHKKIINYFSKKNLGLKIKYSYCPPNKETGYRLNLVKSYISEDFLLMYSDNYCSLNFHENIFNFKKHNSLINLTVSEKSKGNIEFIKNRKITYHTKRKKKLKYVDVGYMICRNKILKFITNKNISFNKYFNHQKISNKLTATKLPNKYLSISDPKRLIETRKYFKKKNIILIDRDGVLNLKNNKFRYVRDVNELKLNQKIIKILIKFPRIKLICITNQAGIATGEVTEKNLNKINLFLKKKLKEKKINLIEYFVSKDHFKSNSYFRKPNPGLFFKAAQKYKLLLDKTFYIGDDPRDVLASYNANTKCLYIGEKKDLKSLENYDIKNILLRNLSNSISDKIKSNY